MSRSRTVSKIDGHQKRRILLLRNRSKLSAIRIAARLGVSVYAVTDVLRRYNVQKDLRDPAARLKQMIALRESGRTLEDVGADFGISRERVRQLLAGAGREDLLDTGILRGRGTVPRVKCKCRQCGRVEEKIPSTASRYTYCSRECRDLGKSPFPMAKADEAIKMRLKRTSWPEIAKRFRVSLITCYRKTVTRARARGIELPQHSRYYVMGRQPEESGK